MYQIELRFLKAVIWEREMISDKSITIALKLLEIFSIH